jgi:hypothetical protein
MSTFCGLLQQKWPKQDFYLKLKMQFLIHPNLMVEEDLQEAERERGVV